MSYKLGKYYKINVLNALVLVQKSTESTQTKYVAFYPGAQRLARLEVSSTGLFTA